MAESNKSDFAKKVEDFAKSIAPDILGKPRGIILAALDETADGGCGIMISSIGSPLLQSIAVGHLIVNPNTSEIMRTGIMGAGFIKGKMEEKSTKPTNE